MGSELQLLLLGKPHLTRDGVRWQALRGKNRWP